MSYDECKFEAFSFHGQKSEKILQKHIKTLQIRLKSISDYHRRRNINVAWFKFIASRIQTLQKYTFTFDRGYF